MKRLLVLLTALLVVSSLSAQSSDSLWQKANGLYTSGMFSEAAETYQRIVDDGRESADLYYNLANSYYKQGMLGESILYYEKALKLSSSDEDIAHNLELARTQVLDKIEHVPTFFLTDFVNSIEKLFTADEWGMLAIVLFALGLFLIITAYFFTGRLSLRRLSFIAGLLAIVLCMSCHFIGGGLSKERNAIILVPVTTVKSSPDAIGKEIFILHEGTKVRILDELNGWKKVKVSDGNQGWVESKDLEQI